MEASPYREAAERWFLSQGSLASARRLIRRELTEPELAEGFSGFGLAELLADEGALTERARIVGDVALAAGRNLYVGPLLETALGGLAERLLRAEASAAGEAGDEDGGLVLDCFRDGPSVVALAPLPPPPFAGMAQVPHSGWVRFAWVSTVVASSGDNDSATGSTGWWLVACGESCTPAVLEQSDGTSLLLVDPQAEGQVIMPSVVEDRMLRELHGLLVLSDAARLVGIAERVAELSNDHLATRTQFGRTLASFQALQHRAVDRHVDNVLARSLLDQVIRCWDDHDTRSVALPALKAMASASAIDGAEHAVQMFGAMGFTDECDVGLYLRHALVLAARRGDAAEQRRQVGEAGWEFLGPHTSAPRRG